jgi:hypothetical protein
MDVHTPLQQWAATNGYSIRWANAISGDQVGESTRLFFGNVARGRVFYAEFEHRNGGVRRGWVFCPGSFLGKRIKRVKVRWDETVSESIEWKALATESGSSDSRGRPDPQSDPLWDRDLDG